jgi:hypothetical protein
MKYTVKEEDNPSNYGVRYEKNYREELGRI